MPSTLSVAEGLAVLAAGVAAGGINAVVGSGTLVTFPVLLALGYPPVVANVSNTVGLVPGSLAGAYAYRKDLAGHGRLLLRLGVAAVLGALTGGVLLLWLPPGAFKAIVPVLIVAALVLVVAQPRLSRALAGRHGEGVRPRRSAAAVGRVGRRDGGLAAGAVIAAWSVVGGLIGGRWGRGLPPVALRAVIVVVGLAALVNLLT